MGDETFFDILRTYGDHFAGYSVTTADIISVAEAVGGRDLQDFFRGRLYGEAVAPIPCMGLAPR